MESLKRFLRDVESAAFWRGVVPWLHIEAARSQDLDANGEPSPPPPRSWPASGYLELGSILDPAKAASLARAVTTLRTRALHPTFLYVYDEAWNVLDALRPRLALLLGRDLDVLADVWAWYIDPRTDPGGWPIHRGVYEDVRGADGTPELVNVWVALTDATERNACMHLVPFSHDPHYPADLPNLTALERRGLALPTPAGSALVWNANVAHWGGSCDPSYGQPRISMSFTLRRRPEIARDLTSVRLPLAFRGRLDVIAEQFATYGEKELGPEQDEMRWATIVGEMLSAARALRAVP
jgi:hypothetical protein